MKKKKNCFIWNSAHRGTESQKDISICILIGWLSQTEPPERNSAQRTPLLPSPQSDVITESQIRGKRMRAQTRGRAGMREGWRKIVNPTN